MADRDTAESQLDVLTFNVIRWPNVIPLVIVGAFWILGTAIFALVIGVLALDASGLVDLDTEGLGEALLVGLPGSVFWGLVLYLTYRLFKVKNGFVQLTPTHLVINYRKASQKMRWENLSNFHISRHNRIMFENDLAPPLIWINKPRKYGHRFIETNILSSVDSEELLELIHKYHAAAHLSLIHI